VWKNYTNAAQLWRLAAQLQSKWLWRSAIPEGLCFSLYLQKVCTTPSGTDIVTPYRRGALFLVEFGICYAGHKGEVASTYASVLPSFRRWVKLMSLVFLLEQCQIETLKDGFCWGWAFGWIPWGFTGTNAFGSLPGLSFL